MSAETNALGHVNYTKDELMAALATLTKEGGATKQEVLDAVNEAGGNDRGIQSASTIRNKLANALRAKGKKLPAFKRQSGFTRASIMDDFFDDFEVDELPDIEPEDTEEVLEDDEGEVELD